MTIWFVTRHPGAADWARVQGYTDANIIEHLDPAVVAQGDAVLGTLPVHLAAEVCARGGRYVHLILDLPLGVGTAVGRNPVSFVVPCHRVPGKSGGLCGYHWGLTRKRAILGWEAGLAA